MKMLYIAHVRMPTGRAHGLTIVKSCEAFAQAGIETTLVIPSLKTNAQGDIFDIYDLPRVFSARYLFVLDFLRLNSGRFAFALRVASFYTSVFFYMLFRSRKDTIIYTRDVPLLLLSLIGFRIVFECHVIPSDRTAFFRRCRRAYRIVTISQALKRAFVEAGFESNAILVAPSGVDLEVFGKEMPKENARRSLDLPAEAPIALYSGNFTTMGEDKGIAEIIHALKEVPTIMFVAIGGIEPDIHRYTALAAHIGVGSRVRFFTHAPQATLALYQQAADMLLMPFPDTPHYRHHMSPVKMFEYMASSRPIIASDLPTIREVLNENNALIVPPGNTHALAHAMRFLLAEPAQGESLARQARADAQQYTWNIRAQRILAFIRS